MKKFLFCLLAVELLLFHGNLALAQTQATNEPKSYSGVADQIRQYMCAPTEDNYGRDPSFFEGGRDTGSTTGYFDSKKSEELSYEAGNRNQAKDDLYRCINQMYKFAIVLASVIGVLFIVIAGYIYMGSEGNDESVKKAKDILVTTVASFIILFIGYILLKAINPDLIKFADIQPPSVKVPTASAPQVTYNPDGTPKTVTGGAGKTPEELRANGCDFQSAAIEREVGNMPIEMFEKVKSLCYNASQRSALISKPFISSIIGIGKHADNSYHYKGCAVDFADGNGPGFIYFDTPEKSRPMGKIIFEEAKKLFSIDRINPSSDRQKTDHIHVDLGDSCPNKQAVTN